MLLRVNIVMLLLDSLQWGEGYELLSNQSCRKKGKDTWQRTWDRRQDYK